MTTLSPLPGSRADRVDAIAAAVRQVPGVADLHGGARGEVGTYLPGRRLFGVRLRPEVTQVHVSVLYGAPVRETAAAVREAVARLVSGPVDVTVEDVVSSAPGDVPEPDAGRPTG